MEAHQLRLSSLPETDPAGLAQPEESVRAGQPRVQPGLGRREARPGAAGDAAERRRAAAADSEGGASVPSPVQQSPLPSLPSLHPADLPAASPTPPREGVPQVQT